MDIRTRMMQSALSMAETGRGITSPNPFVGSIIVKNGEVIARGVTQKCGSDHAEVQALRQAGDRARGGEMYVTLEPCCHQGRTPPCTKAIIEAGIKKVYVGIKDPNPQVNGGGIKALEAAGIEVETGLLGNEVRRQLEYYLLNQELKRPFVILKTAMTIDGCIAAADGSSKWITGEDSRRKVHTLRSEVDAVITGIGTVLTDDPQLNSRQGKECRQPCRVVLDSRLQLPLSSKQVRTAKEQRTIVFCSADAAESKKRELSAEGVEVIRGGRGRIRPEQVLEELYQKEISVVLLEGGEQIVSSFETAGLIDKYLFFIAPMLLGNGKRVFNISDHTNISDNHKLQFNSIEQIDKDLLITAYPVR